MDYIIIGAGIAGIEAAKQIRRLEPASEIVVITQECYPLYSRPRIPELLAKEVTPEDIFVYKYEWYHKNKIQLYLNCKVKSIDPENKKIILSDKSGISYSKLLLAAGSSPAFPPIHGINTVKDALVLRSVEDTMKIIGTASHSKVATVIGGGLLGLESGNALRKLGLSVTILEIYNRLLPRQLDAEGGEILQKQMEDMGLKFMLGVKTISVKEHDGKIFIELDDGRTIETDFILVSAGIRPNTNLASEAGISVNKGILVNDHMETNVSGIYAAGDVAEHKDRLYGIWPAAQRQGVVAGINIAGGNEVYTGTVPCTTLKVVGIRLTSMGDILTEDQTFEQIKIKNTEKNTYRKLYIKNGKIAGAIFLGDTKNAYDVEKLMERNTEISNYKDKILEPGFDVKSLLR
ncbi:MAG: NAD(P)/FAD-dependent oxidoreductase [Candidatus Loosdrechtia sp.]|uniref:NAD(P)/FAD-dependent oxidoreductase n=1 Tax=Candidatus Loosdrechtia sp. TaxID=3101272 RepID=UPI003A723111|nr:MAG: FAD-dependent oxidoreductase [Candidatus Jettenia sp. AMX2]